MAVNEPKEIVALRKNLESITDIVRINLQGFANKLVEKDFIAWRDAQNIITSHAKPNEKVGELMASVFAKMQLAADKRALFDKFVGIFSTDSAYSQLVEKLNKDATNGTTT